ncbi:hypothetical protein [Ethanoligenens harbinense]|uniref:DUF202 domain-containing protein n=1 Tax=Ethanoligenens harbinense (strain DSM 18485 / JCM 12961 / CGMCC 1.5033 / YUAN-3) TaxID=663278 RepID=E6U316_ETHHY|nr:hypothetical protein [Ethanoligenens harbinense]ADU26383.1 hypothetical protein Ethha_0814 [Ethanoligenens harbinense YUAN-3]AVQ95509.1 hypothetical protein CXQ68_04220 [Ethanoligenens harbinense YUAN-3]AYF38173.1 hypothetical protein CXP51_04075 [Ethanoligenens harbinense]AYF40918.1 hypothetical protein CN246_04210 [Ethanoligenens harbinense]QCN91750.1 hypothetical protein DRA42_04215 [Ethanoligenens harbinense]
MNNVKTGESHPPLSGQAARKQLRKEADMQTHALEQLAKWRLNASIFSAFGLILAYCGLVNKMLPFAVGVIGLVATGLFAAGALLVHLSICHGKKNVAHLNNIAESK